MRIYEEMGVIVYEKVSINSNSDHADRLVGRCVRKET